MNKKFIWLGIALAVTVVFLTWLFIESSKPLNGTKIADLGREHIEAGKEVGYNSNPPTSGPHYADWIKAGVYEEPKDDRYLVHSLEHGYVIISYNCDRKVTLERHPRLDRGSIKWIPAFAGMTLVNDVYAHGVEEEATRSASPSTMSSGPNGSGQADSAAESTFSGQLSEAFRFDECHSLVDQLISVYEKKGKRKLIIVPRPNLDAKVALTAWEYLDKMNDFDSSRIEKFIDTYLNQGPEKTIE